MKLVLIGLRGSGKTTVGRIVAERLGVEFMDCDEYIERKTQLTIREIFERCGEQYFRIVEGDAIRALVKKSAGVLATGGGAVLHYKNVHDLRSFGKVIFLDVQPEIAWERIRGDSATLERRPFPPGEDPLSVLREQAEARRPYYLQAADAIVPANGCKPERVADRVLELLAKLGK